MLLTGGVDADDAVGIAGLCEVNAQEAPLRIIKGEEGDVLAAAESLMTMATPQRPRGRRPAGGPGSRGGAAAGAVDVAVGAVAAVVAALGVAVGTVGSAAVRRQEKQGPGHCSPFAAPSAAILSMLSDGRSCVSTTTMMWDGPWMRAPKRCRRLARSARPLTFNERRQRAGGRAGALIAARRGAGERGGREQGYWQVPQSPWQWALACRQQAVGECEGTTQGEEGRGSSNCDLYNSVLNRLVSRRFCKLLRPVYSTVYPIGESERD